jgi:hypothetical protein
MGVYSRDVRTTALLESIEETTTILFLIIHTRMGSAAAPEPDSYPVLMGLFTFVVGGRKLPIKGQKSVFENGIIETRWGT